MKNAIPDGIASIGLSCAGGLFERRGTRDDLGELGRDLCLTQTVELSLERVAHLAGVVGRGFHRDHSGDVF